MLERDEDADRLGHNSPQHRAAEKKRPIGNGFGHGQPTPYGHAAENGVAPDHMIEVYRMPPYQGSGFTVGSLVGWETTCLLAPGATPRESHFIRL